MEDFNYKHKIKELEEEIASLEDDITEKDSEISLLEEKIDELESGPDFDDILVRLFDDYSLELCEGGQFLFKRYAEDILDRVRTGSYNYLLT